MTQARMRRSPDIALTDHAHRRIFGIACTTAEAIAFVLRQISRLADLGPGCGIAAPATHNLHLLDGTLNIGCTTEDKADQRDIKSRPVLILALHTAIPQHEMGRTANFGGYLQSHCPNFAAVQATQTVTSR
jgi:hypothetical protein